VRRRALLASVASAGTAGCLGDSRPRLRDDGDGDASPAPDPDGPAPDGLVCPPFEVDTTRVVCSFERDGADVYPTVNRSTVPVRGEELAAPLVVTVHNDSGATLRRFNPNDPDLYAYVGDGTDGWSRLPRKTAGDGFVELEPGETVSWQVGDPSQFESTDRRPRPGTYAFVVEVPEPGGDDGWVACLAAFRLTAG